jgi:hypothetical protein
MLWGKLWKDPPCLMGKLTISMAMFNSFLYVYQRVIFDWGSTDDIGPLGYIEYIDVWNN